MADPEPGAIDFAEVRPGDELSSVMVRVCRAKMAIVPAVTLDMYPGHHDDDYARSIGFHSVFMNTMPLLGLLDRQVTDWAGPRTQIAGHGITLLRPIFVGDDLIVSGRVKDFRSRILPSGTEQRLLDVENEIRDGEGGLKCKGSVSIVADERRTVQ